MASFQDMRETGFLDPTTIKRARETPEEGPRILFFSGGSALNGISRRLKTLTHNSGHIITTMDSGGSSQVLREAFGMPAIGDLRSRLMALADETMAGEPEVYALFSHRFPTDADQASLRAEVGRLASGKHTMFDGVPATARATIQSYLAAFLDKAPEAFDYRYASIGNLILAGGYIDGGRELASVIGRMAAMVDVRGTVRPVIEEPLQIGVGLADGREIISQRLFSGKEAAPITSRITRCFLSDGTAEIPHGDVLLPQENVSLIAHADAICYPPGSLYSSVVANLLPAGVGRAVAARAVPKVYLPSLGSDPEVLGHSLADQVEAIIAPLRADTDGQGVPTDFITDVVCDITRSVADCGEVTARFGIACHRLALGKAGGVKYDPELAAQLLVTVV